MQQFSIWLDLHFYFIWNHWLYLSSVSLLWFQSCFCFPCGGRWYSCTLVNRKQIGMYSMYNLAIIELSFSKYVSCVKLVLQKKIEFAGKAHLFFFFTFFLEYSLANLAFLPPLYFLSFYIPFNSVKMLSYLDWFYLLSKNICSIVLFQSEIILFMLWRFSGKITIRGLFTQPSIGLKIPATVEKILQVPIIN